MTQLCLIDTPWGVFGYAASGQKLVASCLPDTIARVRRKLTSAFPGGQWCDDVLPRFQDEVIEYFTGEAVRFSAEFDLVGRPTFHQRVLRACSKIPFGATVSYGELARRVGHPNAARAVGQAMAGNPLPLVVPCHRVVASNGGLGGFSTRTGTREKMRLLRHENPLYAPAPAGSRKRAKPTRYAESIA